jgi:hypothetical protein
MTEATGKPDTSRNSVGIYYVVDLMFNDPSFNTAGKTRAMLEEVLREFFDTIGDAIVEDEYVNISGLGSFAPLRSCFVWVENRKIPQGGLEGIKGMAPKKLGPGYLFYSYKSFTPCTKLKTKIGAPQNVFEQYGNSDTDYG